MLFRSCLRINGEICRVSSINYDTLTVSLSRGPNVLGTTITPFNGSLVGSYVDILSGNYNIIQDQIYFDEPPLEGKKLIYTIPTTDVVYNNYSFNLLTDRLTTGSQVLLLWTNPPQELATQQFVYLIKNSSNNFSFATSYANAFNGTKIQFSNQDRKSTRLNSSHVSESRMPSSA